MSAAYFSFASPVTSVWQFLLSRLSPKSCTVATLPTVSPSISAERQTYVLPLRVRSKHTSRETRTAIIQACNEQKVEKYESSHFQRNIARMGRLEKRTIVSRHAQMSEHSPKSNTTPLMKPPSKSNSTTLPKAQKRATKSYTLQTRATNRH
jgi:hypothetical protein